MLIIGCDYHPGFQQIAFVDTETGEADEQRLTHREEAEQFYRTLQERRVRIGMESSGHARWFERLLRELQFELWIGDAAEIRTKRVRKQKTDRQDAQLLLQLMIEDRFPRIWVADVENRDLRQLLWRRHRLVQMRTRVMNQLYVVALNEGLRRKKALWRSAVAPAKPFKRNKVPICAQCRISCNNTWIAIFRGVARKKLFSKSNSCATSQSLVGNVPRNSFKSVWLCSPNRKSVSTLEFGSEAV